MFRKKDKNQGIPDGVVGNNLKNARLTKKEREEIATTERKRIRKQMEAEAERYQIIKSTQRIIPVEDTLKDSGAEHYCIKYARAYRQNINWLKTFPCNILFIDGNHDNHEFWAKLPTESWNGGQVQRLPDAPNVIHLMRGEYYTIDGLTVWCMGGAESIDKATRTQGVSWWPEEIPSQKEMWHGMDTLEEHGYDVDVILTHTMPRMLMSAYFGNSFTLKENDPTGVYLDEVYRRTRFRKWFCGHMHEDIDKPLFRLQVLYDDVVSIDTKNPTFESTRREAGRGEEGKTP